MQQRRAREQARRLTEDAQFDVTDHKSEPLSDDLDFFVEPPPEIGSVISAFSTMRKGKNPVSYPMRCLYGGAAAAVILLVAIPLVLRAEEEMFLGMIVTALSTATAVVIVWYLTMFLHTCTYVGREGVVRFTCEGSRTNVTEKRLEFADAHELVATLVEGFHSEYLFRWLDVNGYVVHVLRGHFVTAADNVPRKSLYHFGRAAETAWTYYLLARAQAQLQMDGEILFPLGAADWVRLSQKKISMRVNDKRTEIRGDEIAEVRFVGCRLEFRTNDAQKGWFSSTGVYGFPYNELTNAQFFFLLLDRLYDITF